MPYNIKNYLYRAVNILKRTVYFQFVLYKTCFLILAFDCLLQEL